MQFSFVENRSGGLCPAAAAAFRTMQLNWSKVKALTVITSNSFYWPGRKMCPKLRTWKWCWCFCCCKHGSDDHRNAGWFSMFFCCFFVCGRNEIDEKNANESIFYSSMNIEVFLEQSVHEQFFANYSYEMIRGFEKSLLEFTIDYLETQKFISMRSVAR